MKILSRLLPLVGLAQLQAADLPPDRADQIPPEARRPAVLTRQGGLPAAPAHTLPEGHVLTTAAAAPLVTHPIMGCVDDRGRLFVGDAVGVNWNKAQLEANPPNRILLLEDADRDGFYDKSTVFADRMTFPQGGAWLNGSLYVCSPPGLWKLTDSDDDGVADRREMIVSGFDYTGNAADVHGPKVHPNGRLYWCHGRKGHKVTGKDGRVVHEGLASGIWSCRPDGSDVQWHSLGCADNPTGLAFTPQGDILGTCNLYYSNPRGDTLMHWLYGGVYERADQMKAIEGLPRTLERMPVVHNFGHVAVSGCAFGRLGDAARAGGALQLFVTHFNTQRLVRMELVPEGASFKAAENEFLKIDNPDVHLTDVIEDRDGSLLILNTGGWFRIGCPSSLMAKPDQLGAVYRVKRTGPPAPVAARGEAWRPLPAEPAALLAALETADPQQRLRLLAQVAQLEAPDARLGARLRAWMDEPMDGPLEHALLAAARRMGDQAVTLAALRQTTQPTALRRQLVAWQAADAAALRERLEIAAGHLDAADADLARTALQIVTSHAEADAVVSPRLGAWLDAGSPTAAQLRALQGFCSALIRQPQAQALVTRMLGHDAPAVRSAALGLLAAQTAGVQHAAWLPALEKMLAGGRDSLTQVLDAARRLKDARLDPRLQALANDPRQPLTLRLKALDAMKGLQLNGATFTLLKQVLAGAESSAAARIQAATMLAGASLKPEQVTELAPLLAQAGPVELKELLALVRRSKDLALVRTLTEALAQNPALVSQQESLYRTAFSSHPPEIFETLLLPALRRAEVALDARKRQLGPLADKVAARGDAAAGRRHFEAGKGTCIACHKVGDKGRPIGPDLSKIGAIRTERDLLESILFPSNTLARDYEAHVLETSDGQSVTGVIRSHTAEGLLVMDVAGQEKSLAHDRIVSNTALTASLMPMGLDQTMPEQELLDLVAYLRSLR